MDATNHDIDIKPLNITWMQLIWFSQFGRFGSNYIRWQINTSIVCVRELNWWHAVHHVWFNRTTSTSSQNALIECTCLCVANPIRYFLSLIAPTHTHNSNRIRLLLADCYNWMLFYISIIEFSRMHTAHTHRNRTELNGNEFPMNIQMISSLSSVAELFIVWFH